MFKNRGFHAVIAMKLLEKDSFKLINKWKKNSSIIGLTARSYNLKNLTFESLKQNNIIFDTFPNHSLDFFYEGILFCSSMKSKSHFLSNFLNKVKSYKNFKKILIIDDKKEHLEKIASSSLSKDFEIKYFHYLNKPIYK